MLSIDPDKKVSELLELHPKVLDTLVAAGFVPLQFPGIRAVMAHTVTLREACAKHEIAVQDVVQKLEAACNEETNHG
jgi:hypothetical protein